MRWKRIIWVAGVAFAIFCTVGFRLIRNEIGDLDMSPWDLVKSSTTRSTPKPKLRHLTANRQTNSLGQIFAPIADAGVLFCVWDTRVVDFEAFVSAANYDATGGMYSVCGEGWKQQGDSWKSPGFEQNPMHPVVGVSWNDAKAFCEWLTRTERAKGLITSNQLYRLPTDWEWGAAVDFKQSKERTPAKKNRKKTTTYPWGTQWPPPKGMGNYAGLEVRATVWPESWEVITNYDDGYPRTSPVGAFSSNRFGLYDMGGNVWQWCEDFYNGRNGPRVLRGGSWNDTAEEAFAACREFDMPQTRMSHYGFRVVLADF